MREEAKRWWMQAEEDMETAKANLEIKNINMLLFFASRLQRKG